MERCDKNGVDFIFGLPGNAVLDRAVVATNGFSIEDLRAPERRTYQLHLPTRPPLRLEYRWAASAGAKIPHKRL
jgi:hypothetical protein